jgi:hypothetical protein
MDSKSNNNYYFPDFKFILFFNNKNKMGYGNIFFAALMLIAGIVLLVVGARMQKTTDGGVDQSSKRNTLIVFGVISLVAGLGFSIPAFGDIREILQEGKSSKQMFYF